MRICISGTGCQGKSTLIKDFLKKWPVYTTPEQTFRDVILKEKLSHSKHTTSDTQWAILNNIIDNTQKYGKDDKVIFDRGPIDNLVYTLWAFSKDIKGFDDKFVSKTIDLVRESIKLLDVNFLIPITKFNDVDFTNKLEDQDSILDKSDCVDVEFIQEVNSIFQAIKNDWETNPDTKFFDVRDMPAVIEIFGTPEQRIHMLSLYINDSGELIDDAGILNEADLYEQSNLHDQFGIKDETPTQPKKTRGYQ